MALRLWQVLALLGLWRRLVLLLLRDLLEWLGRRRLNVEVVDVIVIDNVRDILSGDLLLLGLLHLLRLHVLHVRSGVCWHLLGGQLGWWLLLFSFPEELARSDFFRLRLLVYNQIWSGRASSGDLLVFIG